MIEYGSWSQRGHRKKTATRAMGYSYTTADKGIIGTNGANGIWAGKHRTSMPTKFLGSKPQYPLG